MASAFTTSVTKDEINLFHKIDRALYTLLVLTLHRDPTESMQVIALFIWLERKGFGFLVEKILSFPHLLVNELAKEAVKCLELHHAPSSSQTHDLFPLMKSTLHQDLTHRFFRENHRRLLQGVATVIDTVCVRALGDIMNVAIERNRPAKTPTMYHPMWQFGHDESVPPDDRTLFITFSKGYPVQEWEVRDFFTRNYGDCVESIYMQDVKGEEQSLFARIVFRAFSMIGRILDETGRAKFSINGKHAWVRKFIPKRVRVAPSVV